MDQDQRLPLLQFLSKPAEVGVFLSLFLLVSLLKGLSRFLFSGKMGKISFIRLECFLQTLIFLKRPSDVHLV